ncbi:MAG: FAD-dependent oxidoreductase [Pseudomonadota bacterium]
MQKHRLVIIGGGYIGVELAKSLEGEMEVTLVEPRGAFVHAPAMIRALVDVKVQEKSIIPYDKLLKNGRLIRSRAIDVKENAVTLENGETLDADSVVIATGASNGGIFKPADESIDAFIAAKATARDQIEAAQRIIIVGAGAVGTELAGEIAHAHPDKQLTLISTQKTLFPEFPAALGGKLSAKLRDMGVDLVLGQRVSDLQSSVAPYPGGATLTDGTRLEADLIIPAIGSKPATALLDHLPGVQKSPDGRVKVDPFLRPSSLPNVFAAGDVVDAGDAMTIVAASRQHPWLAKMLKKRASGTPLEKQKPYSPWGSPPILVPLGPKRGNSYLMVATFGDWVTKQMKGSDLFITKYRKIFGYA